MHVVALLALLAVPTIAAADIVPLDGTWTVTPRTTEVSDGCPAEMQPMLGAMAGQMAQGTAVEITWNGAFDPTGADFASGGDGVEWERVDDETWEADMIIAPETPPVGTLRMQITEPDNIESITMMSVGKMMEAQGQVIPGLESCVLTVISDMVHSG